MSDTAEIILPNPFGRDGRYEIIKQLGSGGMGAVWLASDTRLNRKVALKVCKAATTREAQERFRREAQAAAALSNPNLCPIYDFDEHDGIAYIAMAFIEGSSLGEWAERRTPDQRQVALMVAKLALAMQEAHEAGVIHRDLKPDNVAINKKGEPIVLDFGLARQLDDPRTRLTQQGAIYGTPSYMSPEQAGGDPTTINHAADIYSLGVILYELLTGDVPFRGSFTAVLAQLLHTAPEPPRQRNPAIDQALEAICLKALAKQPAKRHPSMKALAKLLIQAAKTLTKAALPIVGSQPPALPPPHRRNRNRGEIETLDIGDGVTIRFSWVPAGNFFMGAGGGSHGEKQVEIEEGFALGIYPVTQHLWQAVMGDNPSWFSRNGDGKDNVKNLDNADLRQFPVECVSWDDTQQFIASLNQKFRSRDWLFRLPTEAEWEYSCRGGASFPYDCSFHFYLDRQTNDLCSTQANFNGNYPDGDAPEWEYLQRPTTVGSYKSNRLGLYDMHGNVWEWCQDLSEEGSSDRVIRGGSWFHRGLNCRAAARLWYAPDSVDYRLGFRLARVPSVGK